MSKPEIGYEKGNEGFMPNQSYVSKEGVKVVMINGVPHFSVEEIQQKIITECEKMAAETRPIVRSAQDARRIVDELIQRANAVVHNYRPGVPERLGISYEHCRALQPSTSRECRRGRHPGAADHLGCARHAA